MLDKNVLLQFLHLLCTRESLLINSAHREKKCTVTVFFFFQSFDTKWQKWRSKLKKIKSVSTRACSVIKLNVSSILSLKPPLWVVNTKIAINDDSSTRRLWTTNHIGRNHGLTVRVRVIMQLDAAAISVFYTIWFQACLDKTLIHYRAVLRCAKYSLHRQSMLEQYLWVYLYYITTQYVETALWKITLDWV